jgi:enoyl-[acyl-carrier protein] reductase II
VRIKKNRMAQTYVKLEKEGATREELEKLTLGSLRRAVFDGDMETGSVMMGQIAGMVKRIEPLSVIFETMVNDAKQQVQTLSAKVATLG